MGENLTGEWRALPDPGQTGQIRLASLGVSFAAALAVGGVAVARIRVSGGLWEPDIEEGVPHLCLPLFDGPIPSLWCHVPDDQIALADIVAFRTDRPGLCFWRRGEVHVPLGAARIDEATFEKQALRLFDNPLDWLRSGGDGAWIGCWRSGALLLQGVPDVVCGSVEFARLVDADLRHLGRSRPRVHVIEAAVGLAG